MPQLELYYFASCPFCQIVLSAIEQLNLNVTLKDILSDEQALQKLVKDTGRKTVPCLYIDDHPMHESRDIINWLHENKDKLEKK